MGNSTFDIILGIGIYFFGAIAVACCYALGGKNPSSGTTNASWATIWPLLPFIIVSLTFRDILGSFITRIIRARLSASNK